MQTKNYKLGTPSPLLRRGLLLTDKSAVAKSININSDSSPARRTETDFSPLSSSETKEKTHFKISLMHAKKKNDLNLSVGRTGDFT